MLDGGLTMSTIDVRWIQRFNNFDKALKQLTKFIEKGEWSELEQQGLIQSQKIVFIFITMNFLN